MIQITAGTFGYYNGRKVVPITREDGPQKFDTELEARLVKQGVAEYVTDATTSTNPPEDHESTDPAGGNAPQDPGQEDPNAGQQQDDAPEYDDDTKLTELKEIAARYGVDASAMRKKSDVIAAIEAAKAAQQQADDDDGTDDEEPPQLGAADPV